MKIRGDAYQNTKRAARGDDGIDVVDEAVAHTTGCEFVVQAGSRNRDVRHVPATPDNDVRPAWRVMAGGVQ